MKKLLLVVLAICFSATPVLAAQTVYLKDGGTISAKSAWRTKGKVHVLVNRDTLTEFSTKEIDLKRTFASKRHSTQKRRITAAGTQHATAATVAGPVAAQNPGAPKSGMKLPNLPAIPKITGKNPEDAVPKGESGMIRKHKKEMAEKANE